MSEKRNFDLALYLRLLWAKRYHLAVTGIIFMALTVPYVLFVKHEVFVSSAKLIVQNPQFIEESPVSTGPLDVKTIASLADDLSLIDSILIRLRADNEALQSLATKMNPNWKSRDVMQETAKAIAQISSTTDIQKLMPMPDDVAAHIKAYSTSDIIGILKMDPDSLAKTDPLFFRENFEAKLHVAIQTAYRIEYQPIVTLAVEAGSAEGAAAIARMWRDMLLERLLETTLTVGDETIQDLNRKQKSSYKRWQENLSEASKFQKEHNVSALESEVKNLSTDLETYLRPLYYRSLTESATSALLAERLGHELEMRRLNGGWIGNQIQDTTQAQQLLRQLNEESPETVDNVDGSISHVDVRKEVIQSWLNLERAQNHLNDFLNQSNLESKRAELEDIRARIANNRVALEGARSQLMGASSALAGINELLKSEEPEKVIDDWTADGQVVKRRVENPIYTQLQTQKAQNVAIRDSSMAVVEHLESSLKNDSTLASQLQSAVNKAEARFADLNSRVLSAQAIFDSLKEDFLTVADQYRRMRLLRDVASEQVVAVSKELTIREKEFSAKQGKLHSLRDEVQALTASAEAEKVSYDTIAEKQSQAELVLDSKIQQVQKYLEPTVPKRRISPRRTLSCLVAGFLGVLLAILYFVLKELIFPPERA